MSYFYRYLKQAVDAKGLSFYRLHFMSGVGTSQFSAWKTGRRVPSDNEIKLLAAAGVGLDETAMMAWRAMDRYSPEVLRQAVELLRQEVGKKKPPD